MISKGFPFLGFGSIGFIVILVSIFWRDNLLLSALLVILGTVTLRFWHTKSDKMFFIVPAILGPSMEAVCIYFGAWAYSNPTFLIPVWLPLVWGIAGISIGRISNYFIKRGGQVNDS